MAAKTWIQRFWLHLASDRSWFPGFLAAAIALGLAALGAWQPLERVGYNVLFQAREVLPNDDDWNDRIVVIGIDDASLEAYGQFPWSRQRYVQLLQALEQAEPAAIGLDILFVDPGSNDDAFAQAIAQAGNVVLAKAWDREGKPLEPVKVLTQNAVTEGHILHQAEGDGITRQIALWVNNIEPESRELIFSIPALGVATVEVYNAFHPDGMIPIPEPTPNAQMQTVWMNWPGRTEEVNTYSFVDVAEGRIEASRLEDKFVLVGFTATAGDDPMRTPLNPEPPTSGVYLHAAAIDNLLDSGFLHRSPDWLLIPILLVLGMGTSMVLSDRQLKGRVVLSIALPVAWFAIALSAFSLGRWWLPVAAPMGTILLSGAIVQLREQFQRQQLMSLFETYVAPETASLIWQRKEEFFEEGELQAQELVATVLFMDIRGFTTISEKLSPSELFNWLNRYLDTMTQCIMDRGGVVDKYIGDAIMAIFGVPFPHTSDEEIRQDALNAISASLAMHERLKQLNEELKAEGKPLIRIGIGVHTGPLMAGSLGGARRLNYSVVGDTVNVAARLESMNKQVHADGCYNILISEETFRLTRDRYRAKQAGEIQLRGREQATTIYLVSQQQGENQK